jgi:hypothetical protein
VVTNVENLNKERSFAMKKMKKMVALLFVVVMVMSFATPRSVFAVEFSDGNTLSEFEQLKADITKIESLVNHDNFQEFYKQNKEWIRDINIRLEKYMANIPKDQRAIVMNELRGEDPYSITGVSDYFYYTEYHLRGGFWTYSLDPKLPVRLWGPSAQAGWEALAGIYYYIAMSPPGSSLHDQYWCHFDLVFADIWDIERGRPDVSYFDTLAALCNPGGGD